MSEKSSKSLINQSIQEPSDHQTSTKDFLLVFKQGDLAEAMHALYYLPTNYKLMILNGTNASDISWADAMIKGRVSFNEAEDANAASASSFGSAIISDDDEVHAESDSAPYVVVSNTAIDDTIVDNGSHFTVPSGSPEALASAVLRIARAAHA